MSSLASVFGHLSHREAIRSRSAEVIDDLHQSLHAFFRIRTEVMRMPPQVIYLSFRRRTIHGKFTQMGANRKRVTIAIETC